MGALEEVPQAALVRPVCRYVREISDARHVLPGLHMAVAQALGSDGPPGPVYVDFNPNLLREPIAEWYLGAQWFNRVVRPARLPDEDSIARAAELLRSSRRPLAIGGRGALGAGAALEKFLQICRLLVPGYARESRCAAPGQSLLHSRAPRPRNGRSGPGDHARPAPGFRARLRLGCSLRRIGALHSHRSHRGRTVRESSRRRRGVRRRGRSAATSRRARRDDPRRPIRHGRTSS